MPLTTNARRRDPTRTAGIRRRFLAEMKRRLREFKKKLFHIIVEMDVFGLDQRESRFTLNQLPREYEDRDDAEKLAILALLLLEFQQTTILGNDTLNQFSNRQWFAKYVEQAYRMGISNSVSQLDRTIFRELTALPLTEEAFTSSFLRRPETTRQIRFFTSLVTDRITAAGNNLNSNIQRILADSLVAGTGARQTFAGMSDEIDRALTRQLRPTVQTEIVRVQGESQLDLFAAAGVEEVSSEEELIFTTAGDERVCPRCLELSGNRYTISEARGVIPVHANCLLGDSLVSAGDWITAGSKRSFNGKIITIRTASGFKLSGTPNHPILSDGRFVSLGLLNEGDHVICHGGSQWAGGSDGNNKNIITTIHNVVESIFASGEMMPVPVPVSAPNFHGDGAGSEVAIIGANRRLSVKGHSPPFEHSSKLNLKLGHVDSFFMNCLCAFALGLKRKRLAQAGSVSGFDLMLSLFLRHLTPFQKLCFALPPDFNSRLDQFIPDSTSGNTRSFSDRVFRLARLIGGNNANNLVGDKLKPRSVIVPEYSDDYLFGYPELARKLCGGDSFPVKRDKINSVDVRDFSGHVFNLETTGGYYIANGIATHNCRCWWSNPS